MNAFKKKLGLNHWPHEFNLSGMYSYAEKINEDEIKYKWV